MKTIEQLAKIATDARAQASNVAAGWDELSQNIRDIQIIGMQAALTAYLDSIGEGLPGIRECTEAGCSGGYVAIRNLLLSALAKRMEAVAKLPERWRKNRAEPWELIQDLETVLALPAAEPAQSEEWEDTARRQFSAAIKDTEPASAVGQLQVAALCHDCGMNYTEMPLDVVLPDEQWKAICPEGGILCAGCIIARAAKMQAVTVARMTLEGLQSPAVEDDMGNPASPDAPAEPWAAEKAAHARGERIEHRFMENDEWSEWMNCPKPVWGTLRDQYRIAPSPAPAGKLTEVSFLSGDNRGDWPEDFQQENGNYACKCCECGKTFMGYKRRIACKICTTIKENITLRAEIEKKAERLAALEWKPASVTPECRDYPIVQDNGSQQMVVTSGSSLCLINAKRWVSIPKLPAPTKEEAERARFEAWAQDKPQLALNHGNGAFTEYFSSTTQAAWLGWQAARAEEAAS